MISILIQISVIIGIVFTFRYYDKEFKRLNCIIEDQWKENDKLNQVIRELYTRLNLI